MMDSITVGVKIQMTENITGDYPINSKADDACTVNRLEQIWNIKE